jgi:hypothetical protein
MRTFTARSVMLVACSFCLLITPSAQAEESDCAPGPWANLAESDAKSTGAGFVPKVELQARVEDASGFVLDKTGTTYSHAPALNTRLHVGLTYQSGLSLSPLFLKVEYGHDLVQGVIVGGSRTEGMMFGPNSEEHTLHHLRKAFLTVALKRNFALAAGITTSDWGLGLIANNGQRKAQPGSAAFTDPRGGDTVLRVLVAGGTAALQVFAAADQVIEDDVLLEGDEARQVVGGLKVRDGKKLEAGLYGVHRVQTSSAGKETRVTVIDAYGAFEHELSPYLHLKIGGEFAAIFGTTELGPSADFPTHDVLQLGGILRVSLNSTYFGGVLDILYASGDRDYEDGHQNGFKADINYEMGLMLFRHVMAAQTARYPATASDPDLSGYPNEDLDRLPTRGAVTNTIAFFPRAWWRPATGLEIYGGPLIALSAVDYSDPLNTKLAGGDNRNSLDATPSGYLGTEFDLGVRYRAVLSTTELTLGLEGALFLPGGAFADAEGGSLDIIYGGRGLVSYAF